MIKERDIPDAQLFRKKLLTGPEKLLYATPKSRLYGNLADLVAAKTGEGND